MSVEKIKLGGHTDVSPEKQIKGTEHEPSVEEVDTEAYWEARKEKAKELIGKTFVFRNGLGEGDYKETEVTVTDVEDILGSGLRSNWVREVKVSVPEGQRSREHMFVLKSFINGDMARNAFERFQLLKQARLKTWTTYRINVEENLILMTSGNSDEKSMMTGNENLCRLAEELSERKLQTFENFDVFLDQAFAEAEKAANQGLYIH